MDVAPLACLALVAWLVIAEPLLGRRSHRRLLAALDAGQPHARLRFYRRWTWQAWLLAGVTALVAYAAGWSPRELGLRMPALPAGVGHALAGVVLGGLLGGLAAGVGLARRKRSGGTAAPRVAGGDHVRRMLPHDRAERRGFAALAVTAGLTEEWIWRGFGAAAVHAAWPQLPLAATVLVLAAGFGWAHVYQGWTGVLATGVLGGLLAWLYLATGSLLLPMLLHVLIDLRAMLVLAGAETAQPAPSKETDVQASIHHGGIE